MTTLALTAWLIANAIPAAALIVQYAIENRSNA